MPTYTYEAMDQTTGAEVKDTIEANSEAEAQVLVRQKGFFVTKIAERGRDKKGKKKEKDKKRGPGKKRKTFAIGGVSAKHAEQWDYYVCPRSCGTFQFRHRTRKVRHVA